MKNFKLLMATGLSIFFSVKNSRANIEPYFTIGGDSAYINMKTTGLVLYHDIRPSIGFGCNIKTNSLIISPNINILRDLNADSNFTKLLRLGLSPAEINFGVGIGLDFNKVALLFEYGKAFHNNETNDLIQWKNYNSIFGAEIRLQMDKNLSVGFYTKVTLLEIEKDNYYSNGIDDYTLYPQLTKFVKYLAENLVENTKYVATGIRIIFSF
ncbi:MAG: hypothetical protein LBB13_00210 [Rickettsiales bacterium]|jgi:hypothetical protein|nr:hypothetical protein [Rickettsiales bacterium]